MKREDKRRSYNVQAGFIGCKVIPALHRSYKNLCVHSIFNHALYLSTQDHVLIKVIKDKDYLSPTSLALRGAGDFSFNLAQVEQGTEIIFNENGLTSKGNLFTIDFKGASTYDSPRFSTKCKKLSVEEISLNLRILQDVSYTCPSKEGLVPLLENVELYGPLEVFARKQKPTLSENSRPYIDMLMWGLYGRDVGMAMRGAGAIIGLGPGLTPSCDDFLTGLILSLNLGGPVLFRNETITVDFFKRVSKEICMVARNKTTIYSLNSLREAVIGEGTNNAVELIYGIIAECPKRVADLSKRLVKMGKTTGADMAVGICYGIRLLTSIIELRELNEYA